MWLQQIPANVIQPPDFSMHFFLRSRIAATGFVFAVIVCAVLTQNNDAAGQIFGSRSKLTLTVTPQGSAAKDKPIPVGGNISLAVTVRNETKDAVGPLILSVKAEGFKAENQPNWKAESGNISGEIVKLEPGASVERLLRLRVEKAPFPASKAAIVLEARAGENIIGSGSASILVADCAGAFREKLGVLRPAILQNVRDTADAMRKPDATLPGGRTFPLTNARKGEILTAERLALPLSARGAADMQMTTEWMRFLIQRWVSELNSYSTQPAHPGLCANNYYQIAGYREGLQPITKRLDGFKEASTFAMTAARLSSKDVVSADVRALVLQLAKSAEIEGIDDSANVFTLLSTVRNAIARGKKLEAEQMETLSLAETAAWLQETNKRGQALTDAIEKVLGTIAAAHKESCVCAF